MIAQLTGRILHREDGRCVIDVRGVGYLVQASTRTLAALADQATVFTEMQVREDAITLFGFIDAEERDWFRLLTTVQGVGGRVALNVLSTLSPRDLAAAIASGTGRVWGARRGWGRSSRSGSRRNCATRRRWCRRDRAGLPWRRRRRARRARMRFRHWSISAIAERRRMRRFARGQERLGPAARLDALIRDGLKELAR